ncbi:MAG: GntR family transcriptional regulator [Planctomycetota bacterium]
MDIRISLTDGVPIYQQIVTQVRYLIAAGSLEPGIEMPPIRVLAEQLQVNPNTVARAYRELELEGTVEKRSTRGTFVSDSGSKLATRHRQAALHERIDQLLAESTQLGFSVDQLIKEIHSRSRVMERMQKKAGPGRGKSA